MRYLLKSILSIHAKAAHLRSQIAFISSKKLEALRENLSNGGPSLSQFIQTDTQQASEELEQIDEANNLYFQSSQYQQNEIQPIGTKRQNVYFEVYGCQMNVSDTEVVYGILSKTDRFHRVHSEHQADIILIMTCSIREGAETKIWNRLKNLRSLKQQKRSLKIGILGCMAERLKETIVHKEKIVDVICGPDAYRTLPTLLDDSNKMGSVAMNVQLSLDETYADISPLKLNSSSKSAFVSIQRGCDNMCTFCIVPFVRGRERSRPIASICDEIRTLAELGYKEVTLLGQNVNSYRDTSETSHVIDATKTDAKILSKGFKSNVKVKAGGRRFSDLLEAVSLIDPEMRVRFTSPHPKEFPDELLVLMKERGNICKQIHLPAQSGSSTCLERMRRGYTREAYLDLVDRIREIVPNVALSSDFIAGFCGESDEEHRDTVSLLDRVRFSFCFAFPYSMRQKTKAFHRFKDDVPDEVKSKRHMEIIETFRKGAELLNKSRIGQVHLVMVEGESRRSSDDFAGRNDHNTTVIFGKRELPVGGSDCGAVRMPLVGDYVACRIGGASSQTLRAEPLYITSLQEFYFLNK